MKANRKTKAQRSSARLKASGDIARDSTERQRAEEALRESEHLLRTIADNIPALVSHMDQDRCYRFVNQRYAENFGKPIEAMIGKPYRDIVGEAYYQATLTNVNAAFSGQRVFYETSIDLPGIGMRWLMVSYVPDVDEQSNVKGISVVGYDITERKRAEEALQQSEKRFRALIENSADAISLVDANGTVLYDSPSYSRMLGYRAEDRMERNTFELVHPDDREHLLHLLAGILQKPGQVVVPPTRIRHADGSWHWIEGVAHNLLAEPSVQAIVVNFRDITARKHAEEALRDYSARLEEMVEERTEEMRESEQWLSTTLRSIGDAVMATDARGVVTLMNPVAENLTGWDEAEAVGKPLEDVFHIINEQTGERAENPVARVLREGTVVGLANHTVLVAKDGTQRPIADSGAPMKDEEETIIGTVMVFRDIIEHRRAEAALERRVAELSALNAVAAIVTESLDVGEILDRAIVEPLRQVGVEAAAMLLLDEEAGELALVAHRGLSDEFIRAFSRMKLGEGLAGKVAQTGQPAVTGDLAEYPGALKAYLEGERIRSAASVPLVGHTGVIGVMNLGTASPQYFDAAGLELLVVLGRQIGIGVEKARLYAETRRRNRELSVLYTISRATAQSLKLEVTLNNALEATLGALDVEVGGIYLMEPDGETLTLRVVRGVSDEVARNLQRVKLGEGMSGRAAAEKKPVVLDVQDYPSQRLAPYIVQERLQSLASMPLLSAGQAVGAMNLSTRRIRAFPPEELELLTAIGQQLGSAVQNARLYEAVQQELAERKRAEEALRDAQEHLIRQEKLAVLGQLAGGVGHELRNPLGAIKNAAYFLNIALEEPEPEVKETLEILEKEVRTSERIISSLLDFARPKPPVRRKVDVNEIVREALSRAAAPDAPRVAVVSQLEEGLPIILADPDQLAQVFGNIIHNGIQAMPKGGQLVVKTLEVSDSPLLGGEGPGVRWVTVSFTDTGVGISEENLKKIFEPLFTTKSKGIGLGLAVTKTLVEGHGGSIKVESEEGKGSTFVVKLPAGRKGE
jgi:PAS domain S-box-containing protein